MLAVALIESFLSVIRVGTRGKVYVWTIFKQQINALHFHIGYEINTMGSQPLVLLTFIVLVKWKYVYFLKYWFQKRFSFNIQKSVLSWQYSKVRIVQPQIIRSQLIIIIKVKVMKVRIDNDVWKCYLIFENALIYFPFEKRLSWILFFTSWKSLTIKIKIKTDL